MGRITPPPPIAVPLPSTHTQLTNAGTSNGHEASPGGRAGDSSPSPGKNGVRNFRDGILSRKAASLVGKGLPWPEASASVHDTKNMVRSDGVPWEEKVRRTPVNCPQPLP